MSEKKGKKEISTRRIEVLEAENWVLSEANGILRERVKKLEEENEYIRANHEDIVREEYRAILDSAYCQCNEESELTEKVEIRLGIKKSQSEGGE